MNITCPICNREYLIDDNRVPPGGITARCTGCGHRFRVEPLGGDLISCPKCGHRQPPGEECIKCGVIFGRLMNESQPHDYRMHSVEGQPQPFGSPPQGSQGFEGQSAGSGPSGRRVPSGRELSSLKGDAIRFGWDTFKQNPGFLIGVMVVSALFSHAPVFIGELVLGEGAFATFLLNVISWILQSIVSMGLIKISLKFCDGEKPELADLFSCVPLLPFYIISSLLYGLIVFAGMLLLIVPGVIWTIKFMFFGYLIVEKELGPVDALKGSATLTNGAKWDLFILGLLLFLINVLGALALLMGLLVTIPISMIAMAFAYRRLQEKESRVIPAAGREDLPRTDNAFAR